MFIINWNSRLSTLLRNPMRRAIVLYGFMVLYALSAVAAVPVGVWFVRNPPVDASAPSWAWLIFGIYGFVMFGMLSVLCNRWAVNAWNASGDVAQESRP